MARGQATQSKQGRQKQDFFGKKHELTICVGMALFGVLPTLSHAQSFVTSDDITRPNANSMMSHTPTPATVQATTGAKIETNSTDDGLGFVASTNNTQTANSAPTITQPKPAHLSYHAVTSHDPQYSPEYSTRGNPHLDNNPYLDNKLTNNKQGDKSNHNPKPTSFVTSDTHGIHNSHNSQTISNSKGNQSTTFISSDNISQDHHANTQKSQSLAKLAQYYHAKPSTSGHVARCEGVWVQPKRESLSQSLGYRDHGDDNDTFYAQADYGYYDNKDYAELAGNVIIEQNGQQIVADKLIYQPSTRQMRATGQVLFSDDRPPSTGGSKVSGAGIIGVADNLYYADDGRTATAHDVAFASTTMNAHGHAHTLNKVGDNQYHMQDVMFSTCPPTERKWHLDASSIDIDNDTGRGVAKNSTLRIGNVPVFYLPYFNFPIDDRRASGFLLPTAGFGSDSFEISTPYYLNLAPNYDATITPTVFSSKNPMLTGEFRYLTQHVGAGVLRGSLLPNDRKYNNEDRKSLFYDHYWQSKRHPHLSAYAHYRYVSDSSYLNNFDTLGIEGNPLNLPRNIGASYYNDYISADLRAETFQTLYGKNNDGTTILDKDKPYSRLPQLSVHYRLPKLVNEFDVLNRLKVEGVHNSAYFKKSIKDNSETEKSGFRMYNQLSASYPMTRSWGYATPSLALTHLHVSYDEDSLIGQNLTEDEGTYSVFAPRVGLDTGLFFEKAGSPFGLYDDSLGGHQVIMPRLKYTYIPYKDQSNIPNFETAIGQISYDRLLSDSWFLGYDRIGDLHAITPALHYRYVDGSGLTRFDGGIAEQIYLDDIRVGLDDSQIFTGSTSGMAWRASAQPTDNFWVEAGGAFTPSYDLSAIVAQLRYQPSDNQLYNFGVIERKDNPATGQLALSAYTASAVFPINNRWRVMTQAQYDYKNDRLLDALVGVNYEDCCYGLSVYARRYRNDLNPEAGVDNAVMAEIRLNGITSGGKLNRLMSDKVLGYDTVNQAWQQDY